jgi:hypothetical protein
MLLSSVYPSYYYKPMPGAPVYLEEEQSNSGGGSTHQQQQMPLLPQQKEEKVEEEENESLSAPLRRGSGVVIWTIITYLTSLAFMGLVIYALVVSNTEIVFSACGDALWNFMCVRLGFAIFEASMVCLVRKEVLIGNERGEGKIEGAAYDLMLLGVFHIVLLGLGAFYVSQAMNNEPCRAALASVSTTNSPLLGILEYVYVGLDALYVISVTCMILLALNTCELVE